jgi:hypothetical protein
MAPPTATLVSVAETEVVPSAFVRTVDLPRVWFRALKLDVPLSVAPAWEHVGMTAYVCDDAGAVSFVSPVRQIGTSVVDDDGNEVKTRRYYLTNEVPCPLPSESD